MYDSLNAEFAFNDDPCPLQAAEETGLTRPWGTRTYCNPPYGKAITGWLRKGYGEYQKGKLVVFLIPSRTDTHWWHNYVMQATEIRFLRGRLKFGGQTNSAPFPSVIVVFSPAGR